MEQILIAIGVLGFAAFMGSLVFWGGDKKDDFDNGGRDPDCAFCGRNSSQPGRPCPDTCRHVRD